MGFLSELVKKVHMAVYTIACIKLSGTDLS